MRILILTSVIAAMLALSSSAYSAGFGYKIGDVVIQDYYNPINQNYLDLVTGAHVDKMEVRYQKGLFQHAWSDIQYTLYRVPNHPRALFKLISFSREFDKIGPAKADEYFEKAIKFTPNEPNTRVMYGVHLHKYPRLQAAIEQYQKALQLNPNHIEAHYNLSLALIDKKDLVEAKKHAKTAYELGHPLPGLREKLKNLNAWD